MPRENAYPVEFGRLAVVAVEVLEYHLDTERGQSGESLSNPVGDSSAPSSPAHIFLPGSS